MLIQKSELAPLAKMSKLINEFIPEDAIENLRATFIIDKESCVIIKFNKFKIQANLKIENVNFGAKMNVKAKDLLQLIKVFTKKSEIEIKLEQDKVIFEGLQDKTSVSHSIVFTGDKLVRTLKVSNATSIDAMDTIVACSTAIKINRNIDQLEKKRGVVFTNQDKKLEAIAFNDFEILKFKLNSNIDDYFEVILSSDNLTMIVKTLKEMKSPNADMVIKNNSIMIEANGIILAFVPDTDLTRFEVDRLLNQLEAQSKWIRFEMDEEISVGKKQENKIVGIRRLKDGKVLLKIWPKEEDMSLKYDYNRLYTLFRNKGLEFNHLFFDKDKYILKLTNDFIEYYLLPIKK